MAASARTLLLSLLALVPLGCADPSLAGAVDPQSCAPNCGKADGLGGDGSRLLDLASLSWPAPLDVEPVLLPSDAVLEGMHAHLRAEPHLTAFVAVQASMRDLLGDPALSISTFGPTTNTEGVAAWGSTALPALVASAIDNDPPVEGANLYGAVSRDPVALLEVAQTADDPVAYAEIVRQVSANPELPGQLRGPAWRYMLETAGRGNRYAPDLSMRTLQHVDLISTREAIFEMFDSRSARIRRNAVIGAEASGLLSASFIDEALEDEHFLVRLEAASHFFEGSDTSEAHQVEFLGRLDDPEFEAEVRLSVIRGMGWSELAEDLFADYPGSMSAELATYRAAVVGDMLVGLPSDVAFAPLAAAAVGYLAVDPIPGDLVAALRRSTVYDSAEKLEFLEPVLDAIRFDDRGFICRYAIELLAAEDSSGEMRDAVRVCFEELEVLQVEALNDAFSDAWPAMAGSREDRLEALADLMDTSGWTGRTWVGAALLRLGVLDEERAREAAAHLARTSFESHNILDAYVEGGGDPETVAALLQELAGWEEGRAQPARQAALYHHAPGLLERAGVRGDLLAKTVSQMLATEPGNAFPLWRVFLLGAPGFRDESPIGELIRLLGDESVSDDALVEAIVHMLVPDGETVDGQMLRHLSRAGVDPHFLALANTARATEDPFTNVLSYARNIVPGPNKPDVDLDLTTLRIASVRAAAETWRDDVPPADEVDAWLGVDRLSGAPVPTAQEAYERVVELAARGTEQERETIEALIALTYAPDITTFPEEAVAEVRELLTTGPWAGTGGLRVWESKFGLMTLDCQRGASYDDLRDRYADVLGLRWDLADEVRAGGTQAEALQTLVESVGSDFGTVRIAGSLAQVCSVGADLPAAARMPHVAESLADHRDINQTYNRDVLAAVLSQPDLDFDALHGVMLRRTYQMVSWFDGISSHFARWVSDPRVDPEHALELLALAASLTKVHLDPPRRDYPSLVRAYVGREDLSDDQRSMALALVAFVRGTQ